ncbi:MAG: type IX secretion system membrane protein PorP/SprF [Draconibacterium sp.]|nr:type IX secretion system membrane protein PorP/SprF [Draconibacterium sp.]
MKKIKIILFLASFVLAYLANPKLILAQQDPLYTQYMDNLLIINPAFAGSKDIGNVLLVARNQWVSLPNSPITRSFAYQTPTANKNVGLGFSVMFDKIGPQKQTGVYFDYSYFLRISENYKLGMGLKGGVSFYRVSLTDLITIDPDPIYSQDIYKNFLPNIGVGFFLFSDDTYFGLSVPKLIENTITRDDYETEYLNRQKIHLYTVAGKKFNLSEDFQIKTNAMLRFVKNTPISFQLSALAGFQNKFCVGGMVRFGDSFAIMTQFQATQKMLIGYSYDFTTSELNTFSSGTHEIMFSYDLNIFK